MLLDMFVEWPRIGQPLTGSVWHVVLYGITGLLPGCLTPGSYDVVRALTSTTFTEYVMRLLESWARSWCVVTLLPYVTHLEELVWRTRSCRNSVNTSLARPLMPFSSNRPLYQAVRIFTLFYYLFLWGRGPRVFRCFKEVVHAFLPRSLFFDRLVWQHDSRDTFFFGNDICRLKGIPMPRMPHSFTLCNFVHRPCFKAFRWLRMCFLPRGNYGSLYEQTGTLHPHHTLFGNIACYRRTTFWYHL